MPHTDTSHPLRPRPAISRIVLYLCCAMAWLVWLAPAAQAEKRRTLGVGTGLGFGFQSGAKSGTFTADGPIVASDGLHGLVMIPSLSVRKFFQMKTKRHFVDLSLETQWYISNTIWKIVQGAQNNILHIPISIGVQLGIWFFRGPLRFYLAPGLVSNTNIFIGGGDGGIAAEFQLGLKLGLEYLIPAKFFGVEFSIWSFGAPGVFGGQNSRHNTIPAGVGGSAGMMFAIAVHFYATKQL